MRWSLVALVEPALAGCSLIYNPNNLPDPRVIDAAVVDANPCALALTDVTPKVIEEGQGDAGSAPALLVIRGDNIVNASLEVELKAKTGSVVRLEPVTDAVASRDHRYLAFTVTAHVDGALGNAGPEDVPLDITVSQAAPQDGSCMMAATQTLSDQLVLRGLPELTDQAPTSQLYSMIMLPDMTFLGTTHMERVELNAVSSITLGSVTASANDATAGPGGFSAGAIPGPGAGGAGSPALVLGTAGGGGGAGCATVGLRGADAVGAGGSGGPTTGEDQILSLDGNRASAGGKGGDGLAAVGGTPGGAGGGGGGMIVLTAGGDITTGDVTADGGAGGSAGVGGGGGGGGAGGTVVVRTSHGTLTMGTIHVRAGAGGSPGGGTGSVGRVRWDASSGSEPSSPDDRAHRGPVFQNPPRVVTAPNPVFMLIGTPGDEIDVRVIDDQDVSRGGGHTSFNMMGIATITPMLPPGYNEVCVKLTGGAESELVANACIAVAFLP